MSRDRCPLWPIMLLVNRKLRFLAPAWMCTPSRPADRMWQCETVSSPSKPECTRTAVPFMHDPNQHASKKAEDPPSRNTAASSEWSISTSYVYTHQGPTLAFSELTIANPRAPFSMAALSTTSEAAHESNTIHVSHEDTYCHVHVPSTILPYPCGMPPAADVVPATTHWKIWVW